MKHAGILAGLLAAMICSAPAMSQTRRDSDDKKKTTTTTQTTRKTTTTTSRSSSGSSSSQVRRSSDQTKKTGSSQTDKKTTTVRRSDGNKTTATQGGSSNTTTVRRGSSTTSGNSQTDKKNTTTVRRSGNSVSSSSKEGSGAAQTADKDRNTTQAANVVSSTNVTRRGLNSLNKNDSRPDDGRGERENRYSYGNDYRMDNHDVVRIPPHERPFLPHDRPGKFYGHDPHCFGYRVEYLPPHYHKVRYYGVDYFRYGDVYYRPFGKVYVVCRPPVGVVLDVALNTLAFRTVSFSFYNNVYRTYSGFDSYSRYIDEQNRAIARNNAIIAQQNAAMAMNLNMAQNSYDIANRLGLAQSYAYADRDYYYDDGVFYIINGGRYQVIVPPAGALVEELPDDFETISLGGAEFYKVDDTVYRVTMISGHPYLEVLGQMYGRMADKYRGY
ncbi:MAG: DUF6515 family protein [Candidatus Cryptobacteroides sp.]